MEAGYDTPGTYAKALVLARGDAPASLQDERTEDRFERLRGQLEWALHQLEAAQARLQLAGLPVKLAAGPDGGPPPNSWAAQDGP